MPEFWMPHWCWWLHALWFDLEYGSEPETIFLWLSTGTQATCQEGRWWLNSDFGFLGSSLKGLERKLCSLCQGFLVSGATLQQCVLELHRSVAATVLVAQSCPTLCDPIVCSPPGSSAHGILQIRILEWVTMPSSRGSSRPRDQTQVFCIAGGFFTIWARARKTRKQILP